MKTTLMIVVLLIVSTIGAVTAQEIPTYKTWIVGKVYDSNWNYEISGANVSVTCIREGTPTTHRILSGDKNLDGIINGSEESDGSYLIEFNYNECRLDDPISVLGFKNGVGEGIGDGVNSKMVTLDLALGVSNIALIPEFGVIVGALTLIGAVGLFFIVRRK